MRAVRVSLVAVLVAGGFAAIVAGASPAGAAVTAAGGYVSVSPARLLDTRDGTGAAAAGALGSNGQLTLQITGRGGVPAGAGSIVRPSLSTSP